MPTWSPVRMPTAASPRASWRERSRGSANVTRSSAKTIASRAGYRPATPSTRSAAVAVSNGLPPMTRLLLDAEERRGVSVGDPLGDVRLELAEHPPRPRHEAVEHGGVQQARRPHAATQEKAGGDPLSY